jgi:hypothetical protein
LSTDTYDDTTDGEGQVAPARRPRPRSPLIIAAIAYGLLLWMVLVVFMLIAWRLSGG